MAIKQRKMVTSLHKMKAAGEKIASLTAYDASFARVIDDQDIDFILVGDSMGMVIQGHETTVPVTVDDVVYHTKAVVQGCQTALIMSDLPFMSYTSPEQALTNAARLMREGGAHMIKLEGGAPQIETVRQLTFHGVPVCAHLGLTPQSVHKLGGYRVQGRDQEAATQMLNDAIALEEAGADAVLLECVPVSLAKKISLKLRIPTIGIGAGLDCDGQILVLQDLLGITPNAPKFSKDFLVNTDIAGAVKTYIDDVKSGRFPTEDHCFI